jgi:hypothetical protein
VDLISSFPNGAENMSDPFILNNRYVIFSHKTDSLGFELWAIDCPGAITQAKMINEVGDFKIFPNPADGIFNVDCGNNIEQKNIRIFDFQGHLIKQFMTDQYKFAIDLMEFDNGFYLFELTSKSFRLNKKIIVAK